jgi:hypothetical protein
MESETLKSAMFLCAILLHVINSMGIDSYVCIDMKLLLRGLPLTQSQILKSTDFSKFTNLFSSFRTMIQDFVRLRSCYL